MGSVDKEVGESDPECIQFRNPIGSDQTILICWISFHQICSREERSRVSITSHAEQDQVKAGDYSLKEGGDLFLVLPCCFIRFQLCFDTVDIFIQYRSGCEQDLILLVEITVRVIGRYTTFISPEKMDSGPIQTFNLWTSQNLIKRFGCVS